MNAVIPSLNSMASGWADAMTRACWQGGLAILLAWLVCRSLPRLSPSVRSWVWRLAYLKLIAGLLWVTLDLPLLPAPPSGSPQVMVAAAESETGARQLPSSPPRLLPDTAPAPDAEPGAPTRFLVWLLGPWVAGALVVLARVGRGLHAMAALRRAAAVVEDPKIHALGGEVCRQFGVRRAPRLLVSEALVGPVVTGWFRPAVLLPGRFLAEYSPAELRLLLSHEVAHLKRHDLAWCWLPILARVLFFFHPLVWLAEHEWRQVQEAACDDLTLAVTDASPAEYGEALLKVAAHSRAGVQPEWVAAHVVESYRTLRRRLLALRPTAARLRERRRVAGATLVAAAFALLVPWRVTARPQPPMAQVSSAPTVSARPQTDPAPRSRGTGMPEQALPPSPHAVSLDSGTTSKPERLGPDLGSLDRRLRAPVPDGRSETPPGEREMKNTWMMAAGASLLAGIAGPPALRAEDGVSKPVRVGGVVKSVDAGQKRFVLPLRLKKDGEAGGAVDVIVLTTPETRFARAGGDSKPPVSADFMDIRVGAKLNVAGELTSAGRLTAARVLILGKREGEGKKGKHKDDSAAGRGGVVKSLDPASKSFVLQILQGKKGDARLVDVTILTTPMTEFRRPTKEGTVPVAGSFADVVVGMKLAARGELDSDGRLTATQVRLGGRPGANGGKKGGVPASKKPANSGGKKLKQGAKEPPKPGAATGISE